MRYFFNSFVLINLALLFFVPVDVNGQGKNFGIKGGANVSNFAETMEDFDYRISFHFGGFMNFQLINKLRVQPELIYSRQGAQADLGDDEWKFDYLNIPFMLKFNPAGKFNIQAGPQLSYLLAAKLESGSEDIDIKELVDSTDFGFNFGIGYESNDKVLLDIRYYISAKNVEFQGTNLAGNVANRVFQLSLGFIF